MFSCTVAGAALLYAGGASAGRYAGWNYKAQIQFNGDSKSETLTNLPVLVQLGTNTIFQAYGAGQAKDTGVAAFFR